MNFENEVWMCDKVTDFMLPNSVYVWFNKSIFIKCILLSFQEGDFILRVHVERYSREIPENHMTFDLEKGAMLTHSEEQLQQQD